MSSNRSFFVSCPKGLEAILLDELAALGGRELRETVAGVHVSGDSAFAYRCCLWSRLGSKMLLPIAKIPSNSADELYTGIHAIDWQEHLAADGFLWIDFVGTNPALRNSQFAAQKVKDAIVDRLRQPDGQRPSIRRDAPDLIVYVRLSKQQAVVNIDLSGASLHRRGYRVDSVLAPLKENLAAALLVRSGWSQFHMQGAALIDPMCGSGTLLIEAAMMAGDIAPGLQHGQFAFERWRQHDSAVWTGIMEEARERREQGLGRGLPEIRGYDDNVLAVRAAERNIAAAGLDEHIRVMRKPLAEFKRPTHKAMETGLILTNPPYGERLGEHQQLIPLYQRLGEVLKSDFVGWRAGVFTSNPTLGKAMGLHSHKKYKLYNGTIPSELLLFTIEPDNFIQARRDRSVGGEALVGSETATSELSAGAQMLANRLVKNRKQLGKLFRKRNIDCYRIYDADLPEYAAAIDLYADHVHIQEYAAPKSVDTDKAEQRLGEIQQVVAAAFEVGAERMSLKQRKRTRGKQQYERLRDNPLDRMITVHEGDAAFQVNLWSYLDTGLFLDHRLVRQKVAELALGKRLLNLFSYTATATVQAALGGAASSVSVDMSKTYLHWARRNFTLNKLSDKHQLVQADCLEWMHACREPYDVILLDPPSFSNSKRMEETLDVQRDHGKLITRCMDLLKSGGTLVFSTNLKRFKMDEEYLGKFRVDDITKATIDKDFQRRPTIHQCFLITER
ncbi:MAG: bifunctional 23S rRNA (guanine(2069)-N(7))-methyltransferase RlmK/23S rRNA (guanine(2445)-N(2))-methyltransferase RlmL [Cellvibrionaceae bacterium]